MDDLKDMFRYMCMKLVHLLKNKLIEVLGFQFS